VGQRSAATATATERASFGSFCWSPRRLLLDKIAQAFEVGVRYPERSVDLFLRIIHRRCGGISSQRLMTRIWCRGRAW